MINVSFAPNETFSSAVKALQVLCTPFSFYKKDTQDDVKSVLASITREKSNHIFLLLSARSALYLFLKTLNLPKGSEVIVQGFTCEAVVLPILEAGLEPVYVDIEKDTLSTTLSDVKEKISTKTKILILQHSFGMVPRDRKEIITYAKNNSLIVIEDLAHGFHPEIFDAPASKQTVKLLSFGRSKLFSSVHGGAIILPKDAWAERFQSAYAKLSYPSLGFIVRTLLYKILTPFIKTTYSIGLGKILHKLLHIFSLFTTEISQREKQGFYDPWLEQKYPGAFAECLLPTLLDYKKEILQRISASNIYGDAFGIHKSSIPILRYPLVVQDRKKTQTLLKKNGVIAGTWYQQPVDPSSINLSSMKYEIGMCKTAEEVAKHIINLPTTVSVSTARRIATFIRSEDVYN